MRHSASALLLAGVLAALGAPGHAAVMISQVYGGGGNPNATLTHDFVELHNSGATAVSLAGWSLQYASAGGQSWSNSTPLSGSIPAGGYFLVQMASGGTHGQALRVAADLTGSTNLSGSNGKLALVDSTTLLSGTCPLPNASVIDFVGYGASASCAETAPAPGPSSTTALRRASLGRACLDSNHNGSDFSTTAPEPRNSTAPPQPCGGPGAQAEAMGGPALPAAIYDIQGRGETSPLANQVVVTRGVVTRVNNNGFFIQDPDGDANPATSDGLFVFSGGASPAAAVVGNLVQVTAKVVEFDTGALPIPGMAALTLTQLTSVREVTALGTGQSIRPTVVTLPSASPGDLERFEGMLVTVTGPLTVTQNFFQGRYGQLTLAAGGRPEAPTNRHRPGSALALAMASDNARRTLLLDDGSSLQNPNPIPYLDSRAPLRAGDTVAGVTGVLDFGLATSSNPGRGAYKIHPTAAPQFSSTNPRRVAPPDVGGSHKVASFNLLNFFTTFGDGTTVDGRSGQGCTVGTATGTSTGTTATNATTLAGSGPGASPGGNSGAASCRGASNLAEFTRQRAKLVAAIVAIDADALGLMEVQNNGNEAVQNLVDGLNAAVGAGTYASVALPAQGTGTDAIRVAMVYKPARLNPVGPPLGDADPVNNRPTLAQTFAAAHGERFTLVVNHLKSKGSCPISTDPDAAGNTDAGDGQGCWNAQRVQQAQRLRRFVASLPAASGGAGVLLIGDFNAYAQEDPIMALTDGGFADQIARFNALGYSYVFAGAVGRLDHAMATATLSTRITGAQHWHINADEAPVLDYNLEFKAPHTHCGLGGSSACPADPTTATPWRSSDHDPVLVGLQLTETRRAAAAPPRTGHAETPCAPQPAPR